MLQVWIFFFSFHFIHCIFIPNFWYSLSCVIISVLYFWFTFFDYLLKFIFQVQPEGPHGSQLPQMLHVWWLWAHFPPVWDGGLDWLTHSWSLPPKLLLPTTMFPWTQATAQAVVLGLNGYSLAFHPHGALQVETRSHRVYGGKQVQRCVMNSQVDVFHMHWLIGRSQCGGERRSVMKFSRRARKQTTKE